MRIQEHLNDVLETFREKPFSVSNNYTLSPCQTYTTTTSYLFNDRRYEVPAVSYGPRDQFYVHVPSWVKVHRAPFNEFGPNLFGLAHTMTGDVFVRDDLEGKAFDEVLLHEVGHVLRPNSSEEENRDYVRSVMASDAKIHMGMKRT